ncbi:MAG: 1,4-alpha-glucan branching enzyme GlgB [Verrucomicrobia subdivision 3 bacterium]|nr:1,4-alpha-glucan branching enzyme GlgB [Limisphaerales bacterium]MCS1414777.1 1,4-alpha-glucan branching enzyme GlgB [Limisphaerales bacterium]
MHLATQDGKSGLVVRVFIQGAVRCDVVELGQTNGLRFPLDKIDGRGFFEGFIAERQEVFAYRLWIEQPNGEFREFYDPYSFLPTLGDDDLYLFNEGTDRQVFHKMGAHCRTINGIPGVSFAVWAPSARRVSVTGDFNAWEGRYHPMRSMGSSGVWELFIPGLQQGTLYKYELLDSHGHLRLKSDPYSTYFESPPNNASIVNSPSEYQWGDDEWIQQRSETQWPDMPISIYEMHLGSWKQASEDGNRPLSYREIAGELVEYLQQMNYTHVEFMPLSEFPFDGSWGYQVTGFFAPTHRFGTPDDLRYLIDTLHQNGIGVILDWVPAHFPKDAFALAEFDGTHLYEHADPRQGEHQDWGTLIFNYGRPEVRSFLIGSALSWCEQFHIDGLRVDAVASMLYLDYSRSHDQWVPNKYGGRENIEAIDFLRAANDAVHQSFPGVLMIAEESTAWDGVTKPTHEGGLGFDLKWNMGWMHDTIEYFQKDPIYRKWHQGDLTFGAIYQHTERFNLTFSHDEIVHGKGSMLLKMGAEHIPEKAKQLKALYAWMWGWPGKKTLFMGSDFGQSSEWAYDRSLDWHLLQYDDHKGIQTLIADLNAFYRRHPNLGRCDFDSSTFQWINHSDHESCVLSFMRLDHGAQHTLLVIGNFTSVTRDHYRVGAPHPGIWQEAINTNTKRYGGHVENTRQESVSMPIQWDGQAQAIDIALPGMSTLFFQLKTS